MIPVQRCHSSVEVSGQMASIYCTLVWALLFPSSQRYWSLELNPLWPCSLVRCPTCIFGARCIFCSPTASAGGTAELTQWEGDCHLHLSKLSSAGLRLTEETSTNNFVVARARPGHGICSPLQIPGFLRLFIPGDTVLHVMFAAQKCTQRKFNEWLRQ